MIRAAAQERRFPCAETVPLSTLTCTLTCTFALAASMGAGALGACGTTQAVRPIGRGNAAIRATLGGPIVAVSGTPLPVPILEVGCGYGVTDTVDVSVDGDVTAAGFGVAHVTSGVAIHLLPLRSPGRLIPSLTVAGGLHVLTNFEDTRVAPQATAVAAWQVGGRFIVYGGGDAGVVFGDPTRLLAGPLLGAELSATKKLGIAFEVKWLAPYYDVAPLAPDWVSPGSRGYFAVLIGIRRTIGPGP